MICLHYPPGARFVAFRNVADCRGARSSCQIRNAQQVALPILRHPLPPADGLQRQP